MKQPQLLWLDDMRNPKYNTSFGGDIIWVKTYHEFIDWINENGLPDKVSFDYSLGDIEYDGMSCAKMLISYCIDNLLPFPRYSIHSEYPEVYVLREFISAMIDYKELGDAVEEDRKPDTEDQKEALKYRNVYNSSNDSMLDFSEGMVKTRATTKPIINSNKIGRNEVCKCLSGKKYKRCCGK